MDKNVWGVYLGMGFELAAAIVILGYAGQWIEKEYGAGGFGILIGVTLGLVAWLVHFLYIVKLMEKREK